MEEMLKKCLSEWNIELSALQLERFSGYGALLKEWNEKMNLTAITEDEEIALKHFVDCISLFRFRDFSGKSVIDVGTGAGFPGLVMKIFDPTIKLTLLDSLNKRIEFLRVVCDTLGLDGVELIHARAEDGAKDKALRESFDFCTSRAVAPLNLLAEYDLPFVKVGGEMIALKSGEVDDEVSTAKNAIEQLGGEFFEIKKFILPQSDLKRSIVSIKKVRQTPSRFPRKAGKAAKNPII